MEELEDFGGGTTGLVEAVAPGEEGVDGEGGGVEVYFNSFICLFKILIYFLPTVHSQVAMLGRWRRHINRLQALGALFL